MGPALETIQNCIVWENTTDVGTDIYASRVPTYSFTAGGAGGEGDIAENPGFVDPGSNDYRFSEDSPCIDAGDNEGWMWKAFDLDRNHRIWRGESYWKLDMGAYEYGSSPFRVGQVGRTSGGEAQLRWKSRPADTSIILSCCDLMSGE